MCSEPVMLGGGIAIENTGRPSPGWARKTWAFSHSATQCASIARGSYPLAVSSGGFSAMEQFYQKARDRRPWFEQTGEPRGERGLVPSAMPGAAKPGFAPSPFVRRAREG